MWDVYNTMGRFYASHVIGVKSSHYDCTQSQGADNTLSQSDTETKGLRQAIGKIQLIVCCEDAMYTGLDHIKESQSELIAEYKSATKN